MIESSAIAGFGASVTQEVLIMTAGGLMPGLPSPQSILKQDAKPHGSVRMNG